MGKDRITYLKRMRNGCYMEGYKALAAFYQISVIREIENGRFYFGRKNDLEQHWAILRDLLRDALGTDDMDYQNGIFYEVSLAEKESRLTGREKECETYRSLFERTKDMQYVFGVYQIHMGGIMEIAGKDRKAAGQYADNLLVLLEMRYGTDSWQYAKMKMHILGEYYYQYRKEEFLKIFKEEFDYLRRYEEYYPVFFENRLYICTYIAEENRDEDYDLWMTRYEDFIEQKKGSPAFGLMKSRIAYIKAKALERQGRTDEAFQVLQEAILEYVDKEQGKKDYFYANLYLIAAYICIQKQEYTQMLHYAQQGMAICEEAGQKDSELYYQLYNHFGIMYIEQQAWGEAERFYGSSLRDIEEKFGRENETYVVFAQNIILARLNQGKDIGSYIEAARGIKDKTLREKHVGLFNMELNDVVIKSGRPEEIKAVYDRCSERAGKDGGGREQERLDVLYLGAMVNAGRADAGLDAKFAGLGEYYREDFTGEPAILYWGSRMLWEWKKGDRRLALKIAEKIVPGMQKNKNSKYDIFEICYIQLLILNGQRDKAEKSVFSMLDRLAAKISDIGPGRLSGSLLCVRALLSMYIYLLKKGGNELRPDEREKRTLLEKVMYCKTIEREMKSLFGKYQEDEIEDLSSFKEAHRKLSALEIRRKLTNFDAAEYEKQKMRCLLELAEYETNIRQCIPFDKVESQISFSSIHIPAGSVCIEYFACYTFPSDVPMIGTERDEEVREMYGYIAFVLTEEAGQTVIKDVIEIPLEDLPEEGMDRLQYTAGHSDDEEYKMTEAGIQEVVQSLRQIFVEPVMKYLTGKERIYLALDFLLQMFPMDLLFRIHEGEPPCLILLDSVRYVGEDSVIDVTESDALIIGGPKRDLQGSQESENLKCVEPECRYLANVFHTKPYMGKEASQRTLWTKRSRTLIHISCHGALIPEKEGIPVGEDLLIDSYLMFAGYENWIRGEKDMDYGNGIVSGDDFLFMDLSKTKLVVLSACVSGLGYPGGLEAIHGMRWALSAAGAQNSVTTLWKVADDASAILMLMFYENLRSMPVGKALSEAKKRLRQIRAGELRKNDTWRQILESSTRDQEADSSKPYAHWRYWAGFVCYHR